MTTATGSSPSSVILRLSLLWGAAVTAALAVVGSIAGALIAGPRGVASALVGVLLAALFLAMTAVIILLAGRIRPGPAQLVLFFGIVLGGWALKLAVFVVVLLVLRGQPWIEPYVFFFSALASVVASLVVDMVVMARARVPYVGDVDLPGTGQLPRDEPAGS